MVEHAPSRPFDSVGGVVEVTADVRARRPHADHVACVSVVDGERPHLAVLPGIASALRDDVEQWAADRVVRLRAQGPSLDNWGVWILTDGRVAAQLWVRPVRVRTLRDDEPYRMDPWDPHPHAPGPGSGPPGGSRRRRAHRR